ncbi:hypothetical protein [Kocuria rosea]|uniref:hypothetical protein n=1 Tax=Kocuria rosea TaxID=1275 RepID=UPI000F6CC655|nr:hypothetical protein [Kocuria rosea]VEI49340.1 Uncharacterised protein [Kocuria rosea]
MTVENQQFDCGDRCPQTGIYMIYRQTPFGLMRMDYPRLIQAGDPFPPTPGAGHCFKWEKPWSGSLAA